MNFLKIYFIFIDVYSVFPVCISALCTRVLTERTESDPWQLRLQMAVSTHVGAEN